MGLIDQLLVGGVGILLLGRQSEGMLCGLRAMDAWCATLGAHAFVYEGTCYWVQTNGGTTWGANVGQCRTHDPTAHLYNWRGQAHATAVYDAMVAATGWSGHLYTRRRSGNNAWVLRHRTAGFFMTAGSSGRKPGLCEYPGVPFPAEKCPELTVNNATSVTYPNNRDTRADGIDAFIQCHFGTNITAECCMAHDNDTGAVWDTTPSCPVPVPRVASTSSIMTFASKVSKRSTGIFLTSFVASDPLLCGIECMKDPTCWGYNLRKSDPRECHIIVDGSAPLVDDTDFDYFKSM